MSDKEKILNDEQMEEVSGGHHHHHDHEREKYEGQHGWITRMQPEMLLLRIKQVM